MDDVKRWRMDATAEFGQDAWADPKLDENGYWVRYDDYAALRARLEAVEAKLKDVSRRGAMQGIYTDQQQARAERAEAALKEIRADCIARADKNGVVPIGRSAWEQLERALIAQEPAQRESGE